MAAILELISTLLVFGQNSDSTTSDILILLISGALFLLKLSGSEISNCWILAAGCSSIHTISCTANLYASSYGHSPSLSFAFCPKPFIYSTGSSYWFIKFPSILSQGTRFYLGIRCFFVRGDSSSMFL